MKIGEKMTPKHLSKFFSTEALAVTAVVLTVISQLIQMPGSLAMGVLGIFTAIAWTQLRRLPLPKTLRRFLPFGLTMMMMVLTALWVNVSGDVAHAQFFQGAQDFFQETLGTGDNDATAIVFNAIRALYLLYIAIAFVGVVNAVRQDEDWQTVARTPLLVVVVVTVADVITTLVVDGF